MTQERLVVTGLTKAFGGRVIVTDLAVAVAAGEVVALVGPNGVGKTTVLRCIMGLETPDAGTVTLEGRPLQDTDPAVRAQVVALLDDAAFFPELTVAEHLDLFARAHGEADPQELVEQALATLRIEGVADQLPDTLSSGQRQRLALAAALVRPWDLLIADEPEQRLDDRGRQWLGEWLSVQAAQGRSVLIASHDPAILAAGGARTVQLEGDV